MLILLLVLALVAGLFGGWGHSRYGYTGWSPFGIVVAILVLMLITGHLGGHHGLFR